MISKSNVIFPLMLTVWPKVITILFSLSRDVILSRFRRPRGDELPDGRRAIRDGCGQDHHPGGLRGLHIRRLLQRDALVERSTSAHEELFANQRQ